MSAADTLATRTRQRRRRVSVTNCRERERHLQTSHQLEKQRWSRGAEHDAARRTFLRRKGKVLPTRQALLRVPTGVHGFNPDSVSVSSASTLRVGATTSKEPPRFVPVRLRTWTVDSAAELGHSVTGTRQRRPEELTSVLLGRRRPPLRRMEGSNWTNPRSIQHQLGGPSTSPRHHNAGCEDVTDKVAAFLQKACVLAETDRDPGAEKTSSIEERIEKYESRRKRLQRRTSLVYCPGSTPMDELAASSSRRVSIAAPPTESTIDETDSSGDESERETRAERLERLRALPPLLLPPIHTVRSRQPARQARTWPPPKPRVPRRISQHVWDELKECRYIRQKSRAGHS